MQVFRWFYLILSLEWHFKDRAQNMLWLWHWQSHVKRQYYFIYFILFLISHVTLLICMQTSTKHSDLTSTTTTTTNLATMMQQHHQHHHSSTTMMAMMSTRVGAESNMRKVPKWCISHLLGPRWVIKKFLCVFSVLIDMYKYFWCIKRHEDVCRRQQRQ